MISGYGCVLVLLLNVECWMLKCHAVVSHAIEDRGDCRFIGRAPVAELAWGGEKKGLYLLHFPELVFGSSPWNGVKKIFGNSELAGRLAAVAVGLTIPNGGWRSWGVIYIYLVGSSWITSLCSLGFEERCLGVGCRYRRWPGVLATS